jgi:hypothetical protein
MLVVLRLVRRLANRPVCLTRLLGCVDQLMATMDLADTMATALPLGSDAAEEELDDDSDDEARVLGSATVLLARTQRRKQQTIQLDQQLFTHQAFSLEPCQGQVWPGAAVEVMVTFHPKGPTNYEVPAWCELAGRMARVPVLLQGPGLGPRAIFSFESLDVGDVFINSVHKYQVRPLTASTIRSTHCVDVWPAGAQPHHAVAVACRWSSSTGVTLRQSTR